jgi:hypothetical protein
MEPQPGPQPQEQVSETVSALPDDVSATTRPETIQATTLSSVEAVPTEPPSVVLVKEEAMRPASAPASEVVTTTRRRPIQVLKTATARRESI